MRKFRKNFCQIMISNELKADFDWIKQFVPMTNLNFDVTNPEALTFLIKEFMKNELKYKIKSYSVNYKTKNVSTKFTTPTKAVSYNFEK